MITNVIKHICFIIYTSLKKQSGNNYEYHLWYNTAWRNIQFLPPQDTSANLTTWP